MPKHALTLCAQHSHTGTLALTHTHTQLRSPGHTLESTFVGHVETWVLQQPGAVLPQQLKLEARCQCKQRMRSQRNNLSPSFSLSLSRSLCTLRSRGSSWDWAEAVEAFEDARIKLLPSSSLTRAAYRFLWPRVRMQQGRAAFWQLSTRQRWHFSVPKQGPRQVNKLKCKMQKERPSERHAFIYQMSIELISR